MNQANVNEQYRYDPLQRLTNATVTSNGSTTTLWYEYDVVGNRIVQSVNGVQTSYTYNQANNELTRASSSGKTVVYSYDANGDMLTQNVTTTGTTHWTYKWDGQGDLLKVSNDNGAQGTYSYDGLGRRVEIIEGQQLSSTALKARTFCPNKAFTGQTRITFSLKEQLEQTGSTSLGPTTLPMV